MGPLGYSTTAGRPHCWQFISVVCKHQAASVVQSYACSETLVTLPRVKRYQVRTLDPVEAKAFLEAAKKNRLGALFSVGVGLRLGEVLGLAWEDVDLKTDHPGPTSVAAGG